MGHCPDMLPGQAWAGAKAKYLFRCLRSKAPHPDYLQSFANHWYRGSGCPPCNATGRPPANSDEYPCHHPRTEKNTITVILASGKKKRRCRVCHLEWTNASYAKDPEKFRARKREEYVANPAKIRGRVYRRYREQRIVIFAERIWTFFRLRLSDWYALLFRQSGRCPCGRLFLCLSTTDTPHIDHDHHHCLGKKCCGKCVRGLLCSRCNLVMGHLDADPPLPLGPTLQTYLDDYECRKALVLAGADELEVQAATSIIPQEGQR